MQRLHARQAATILATRSGNSEAEDRISFEYLAWEEVGGDNLGEELVGVTQLPARAFGLTMTGDGDDDGENTLPRRCVVQCSAVLVLPPSNPAPPCVEENKTLPYGRPPLAGQDVLSRRIADC